MSFVDPLDEPINPYTGYPFRKENLDERIRRILEDNDDEIPVATSFVQNNVEQIDTVSSNRLIVSAKQNSVLVKPCYSVNNVSSNCSASSINQNPTTGGDRIANDNHSLTTTQPPTKKTTLKYEKTRWQSSPFTPTESMDTFSPNSSIESDKHTPVEKDLKCEYKLIPYDAVQPLYKMDAMLSKYSSDSVKQIPALLGSSIVKDKSPIIQPPNKRFKLEYKHSFNFIDGNSNIDERSEKFERTQHQSIFQHMDDSMKKEEINQAYQEVTEIVEILWPNPRKVTKDVKVTALNVNEFTKDDVFQMMLDAALNNPNLFKAHELSFTKTQKF